MVRNTLSFCRQPIRRRDDVALAELIAENWRAVLQYKYPQQDWLVKILTPEETGSVIGVSFEEIE